MLGHVEIKRGVRQPNVTALCTPNTPNTPAAAALLGSNTANNRYPKDTNASSQFGQTTGPRQQVGGVKGRIPSQASTCAAPIRQQRRQWLCGWSGVSEINGQSCEMEVLTTSLKKSIKEKQRP